MTRIALILLLAMGGLFPYDGSAEERGAGAAPSGDRLAASAGMLDLRGYDFPERGTVLLKGEWEFYWDRILHPSVFASPDFTAGAMRPVPENWKTYSADGGPLPLHGNATYRLRVATDGEEREYGLRLKRIYSAYRLYVNGALIAENGAVKRIFRDSEAQLPIKTVYFDSYTPTIEIVLQVSNPYYHRAGIMFPPELGTQEQISREYTYALGTDLFLLGVIFIMAAYYFVIALMLKEYRLSSLFFSLFCSVVGLRVVLISGERFLYHIYPSMSLKTDMRLQSVAIYLMIPTFLAFMHYIFPLRSDKRIVRAVGGFSLLYLALDILTSPKLSGQILTAYYPFFVLGLAYMALIIVKAVLHREPNARMEAFGFLFILGAALYDMLVDREILHTDYILPIGLLCFIFVQSVILSKRFSAAFIRLQVLLEENRKIQEALEIRVRERTADILEMNESLIAARVQAEEASSAKSRFLANMSHEMRTPLNGVLGYAELIQETDPKSTHHSFAGKIIEESKILLDLINQLLDLSKIEAEKFSLEIRAFDLHDLLESVKDILRPLADKKELQFRLVLDESLPRHILGDPGRLRQILVNLGGNAVKFTQTGRVEIRVEPRGEESGMSIVLFTIEDTGIGIPREFQNIIFERFTQVESGPARQYGGTGLGTTIAKQLVELMKGSIDLSSEEGKGSTFRVSIPFPRAVTEGTAPVPEQTPPPDEPRPSLTGRVILIVEDYPTTRKITRHHLESAGAEVILAGNGEEGLRCFAGRRIDCILMDVHMPGMDGLEATRRLRALPEGRNIPIIGMTASAFDADLRACREAGMTLVLTKPLRKRELIEKLSAYTTGAAETPTFRQAEFLAELEGDAETSRLLIKGFLLQLEERIARIEEASAAGDLSALQREVHAIKGGAMTIFADPLAEAAARLENMIKYGETDHSGSLNEMLFQAAALKKVMYEFLSA